MNGRTPEQNEYESTIGVQTFVLVLMAMALGTMAATVLLPSWMPTLARSLAGSDPKAYWYLSRGSSFVALTLLWASMALGLGITNKLARTWPGAPAAFAIHEYVSLLGLSFAIFHALVLLGDHYIKYELVQILVPFWAESYKPFYVGLGQAGFYAWLLIALSFYVRPKIGAKVWRALHYVSFITYGVALYHGITSGTDTGTPWAFYYYWISAGSLVFLLMYRIIESISSKLAKAAPRPAQSAAPQARPTPQAVATQAQPTQAVVRPTAAPTPAATIRPAAPPPAQPVVRPAAPPPPAVIRPAQTPAHEAVQTTPTPRLVQAQEALLTVPSPTAYPAAKMDTGN